MTDFDSLSPLDPDQNRDHYVTIEVDAVLQNGSVLPFPIFVYLGRNKYTKVFHAGSVIDSHRLRTYQSKGARNLYIQRRDRDAYLKAQEINLMELLTRSAPQGPEVRRAVSQLGDQVLAGIFDDGVFDKNSLIRSAKIVRVYVELVTLEPSALAHFLALATHDHQEARHAVATSVFSLLLCRALGFNDKEQLLTAGLGGLLHDIGKIGLSSAADEFAPVDRHEHNELQLHPLLGEKLLSDYSFSSQGLIRAVGQHHETWNGSGYPRGLNGQHIDLFARVIAIADHFSGLTAKGVLRTRLEPEMALTRMKKDETLDPQLLTEFADLLRLGL